MVLSSVDILLRYSSRSKCFKYLINFSNTNYRTYTFSSSCKTLFLKNSQPVMSSRSFLLSSQLMKNSVIITFLKDDGTQVKRRAHVGDTIQELIEENDSEITGFGVCGGVTACSTCHVIFPQEIFDKLDPPTSEEDDLIDFAPDHCLTSRLGCNVKIIKEMDGVVIRVPSAKRDQRD